MAVITTLTALAVLVLVAAAMAAPLRSHAIKHAMACTSNYVTTYLSGSRVAAENQSPGCTVAAALENNSGLGWSGAFNGSGWYANDAVTSWYTMSCGYNIYYSGVGRTTQTNWQLDPVGSVTC